MMDNRQWQMGQGSQSNYVQNQQPGQRRSEGNPSWPPNQQVQLPQGQGAEPRRDAIQRFQQENWANMNAQLQWQMQSQQYLNNQSVANQNQSRQLASGVQMHNQNWPQDTSLQSNNGHVVNQANYRQGAHQVFSTTNYNQASNQQFHQGGAPTSQWHGGVSSQTHQRSCHPPAAHQSNTVAVNQGQFMGQSCAFSNAAGTSGATVNYSATRHFAATQPNTLRHEHFRVGNAREQPYTHQELVRPVIAKLSQILSERNIPPHLRHQLDNESMMATNSPIFAGVLSGQTQIGRLSQGMRKRKNKQRTNFDSYTPQLAVDANPGIAQVESPGSVPMPNPGIAQALSPSSAPMPSLCAGQVSSPYSAPVPRPPSASLSYHSHPGTAPMQRPASTASSHHSKNQAQDLGLCLAMSHVWRVSQAGSQGQQHCLQQSPSEVGRGQSTVSNSSRSSTPHAANESHTDNQDCGQQSSMFTSLLSGIHKDIENLDVLEKLKNFKQILNDKMNSLHIHLQDEQEDSGIISHSKIKLYNSAIQEMEALMLALQNEISKREEEEAIKRLEMILAGEDDPESTSAQVDMEMNRIVATATRRESQDHATSVHTSSSRHVVQQPAPELLPVQPAVQNVSAESIQRSEGNVSVQRVGSRVVDRRSSDESRPGDVRPIRPESRESGRSDMRNVRPQSRQSSHKNVYSNISLDVQVFAPFPGRREGDPDYDPEYEKELILEAIEHYELSGLEDVSSASEIDDDNPPEYVVVDEDDIRCWYEFAMRPASPDIMEEQEPGLVISNVQSLSHWIEGDSNSIGVEERVVPSRPINEPVNLSVCNRSDVHDMQTCIVGEPTDVEFVREYRPVSPAPDTVVGRETGQVNSNTMTCDQTLSTQPDDAARMEAMLSRINHIQDYLQNVVDITPPSTPDRSRLRSESPVQKTSEMDVNGQGLPGQEGSYLGRLFSQVVDPDCAHNSGTDSQQQGIATQKKTLEDGSSVINNSELLKSASNQDLRDKTVEARTLPVSKEGHNEAASAFKSAQELDSLQTNAEARRLPEYGKMFEAIESDSEDEDSESVNFEDMPEYDESSEDSLPEITHQPWRHKVVRRRRRLGSSPSLVLSPVVTMSNKDRKMITSVWNNHRTKSQRNQTQTNESSTTPDKSDAHGKSQMDQDSVLDTNDAEKDNTQCDKLVGDKTSSEAANEAVPEDVQSQTSSSKNNSISDFESAQEKGLNLTSDQETNKTELLGLDEMPASSLVRTQIDSDMSERFASSSQADLDSDLKSQDNEGENIACVLTENGMEMQETCSVVSNESAQPIVNMSDSAHATESATHITADSLITDIDLASVCTETAEPVKIVLVTDADVVSSENDVDTIVGKSVSNDSLPSTDCLVSTENASLVTADETNSTVEEIGAPDNVELDIGSGVNSTLPQSQGEVDKDIISKGLEHENEPDDKCASAASELRPETLSQNTSSETGIECTLDEALPLTEPESEAGPRTAGIDDDFGHDDTLNKFDNDKQDQAIDAKSASDIRLPDLDVNPDGVQQGETKMLDVDLKTGSPEPSVSEKASEMRVMDSSIAANSTQSPSGHEQLPDMVPFAEPEGTDGTTDNVSLPEPEHLENMIDENKALGGPSQVVQPTLEQSVVETDRDKLLTQIIKGDDDSLFLDFEPKEKPKDLGDKTDQASPAQPEHVEKMVVSESSIGGGQACGVQHTVKGRVSKSDGEKPLPRLVNHVEGDDDSVSVDVGGLPDEELSSDYNESDAECGSELVFAIAEYFKNSSHDEDTSSNHTNTTTKSEGIEFGEEEELIGDLGAEEKFFFNREISMQSSDSESNLIGDLDPEKLGCSIPAINSTSLERESLEHIKEKERSDKEKRVIDEDIAEENGTRSDARIPVSAHGSEKASAQMSEDKSNCSNENEKGGKPGLGDKSSSAKNWADAEPGSPVKGKDSSLAKPKQDDTESETLLKEKASFQSKPLGKAKEDDTEQEILVKEITSQSKPKSKEADTKLDNPVDEKTPSQSKPKSKEADTKSDNPVEEKSSSHLKSKSKEADSKSVNLVEEKSSLQSKPKSKEADTKSDNLVVEKSSSQSKPKSKQADTKSDNLVVKKSSSQSKPKSKEADTKSDNLVVEKSSSQSKPKSKEADTKSDNLVVEKSSSQSKPKSKEADTKSDNLVVEKSSSQSKLKSKEADTKSDNLVVEKSSSQSKPKSKEADTKSDNLVVEKSSSQSKPKSKEADTKSDNLVVEKSSSQSKPKSKEADTKSDNLVDEESSQSKAKSKQADTKSDNLVDKKSSSQSKSKSKKADTEAERLVKEKDSLQSKPKTAMLKKDSGSKSQKPERENALNCLQKMIEEKETDDKSNDAGQKSCEGGSDIDSEGESNGDYHFEVKTLDELQMEEPDYLQSPYKWSRISPRGRGSDLPWRGRGSRRPYRSTSPRPRYFRDDMDISQNVSKYRGESDLQRESYHRSERRFHGDNVRRSQHSDRDDHHHEYRRSHRDTDDCDGARNIPQLSPERLGKALRLVTALGINDRPPRLHTPDEYRDEHRSRGKRFGTLHPRGRPGGMRQQPPSDRRFDCRNKQPDFLAEEQRMPPFLAHECSPGGRGHLQDDRLFRPQGNVPRDPFEHIDRARQRLSCRDPCDHEEIPRQHPKNEDYHGPVLDTFRAADCEVQRPGPNQGLPFRGSSQERPPIRVLDLPFGEKRPPPGVNLTFMERERSPMGRDGMSSNFQPQTEERFRNKSMEKSLKKAFDEQERKFSTSAVSSVADREQKDNTQSNSNENEDNRPSVSNSSTFEPLLRTLSKPTSLDLKMPDTATHEPVYSKEPSSASPEQFGNKKHDIVTNTAEINKPDSAPPMHIASRMDDAMPQQILEKKRPDSENQRSFKIRLFGSANQHFVEGELPNSDTTTSDEREQVTLKPAESIKPDSVTLDHIETRQLGKVTQEKVNMQDTLPGKQPDKMTGKDCDSGNKDPQKLNQDSRSILNAACVGGNTLGSIDKSSAQTTSKKPDGAEHKSKTSPVKTKSKALMDSREEMQDWLNMGLKDEQPRKKSISRRLSESSKQEKALKGNPLTSTGNAVAKSSEGRTKPVAEPERDKDKDDLDSVAKKLLATKPIGTFCTVTEKHLLKGAITPPQSDFLSDSVQNMTAYLSDYIENPGEYKPKVSSSLQGLSFRKKPPEKSEQKSSDVREKNHSGEKGKVIHRHKHRHVVDEKHREKKSGEKIEKKRKMLEGGKHRKQETREKDIRKEPTVSEVNDRKGKGKELDTPKGQIKQHLSVAPDNSQSCGGGTRGKNKIKKISLEWYKKKKTLKPSALTDSEEGEAMKLEKKTLDSGAFSLEADAKLREKIAVNQARIKALVNRRRVEIIPHINLAKRKEEAGKDSKAVADSDAVKQKTLKDERVSHFADSSVHNSNHKRLKSVVTKGTCSSTENVTAESEVERLSPDKGKLTSLCLMSDSNQIVDKKEKKKPGLSDAGNSCQMQESWIVKKARTLRSPSADKVESTSSSLNLESEETKKVQTHLIDLTGSDSESAKEAMQGSDRSCLEGSAVRSNAGQESRQGKEGATYGSLSAEKGDLVSSSSVEESTKKVTSTSKSSIADKEVTCSGPSQEIIKAKKGKTSRSSSADRGDLASSGPFQETKKAKKGRSSKSSSADKGDTRGSKSLTESKKLKKETSSRSPEAGKRKKKREKPLSYKSSSSDISSVSLELSPVLSRSRSTSRERRARNQYRSTFSPGRFMERRWSPDRRSGSPSHGRHPWRRSRSPYLRRPFTRGRRSLTPVHKIRRSRSPPFRRLSPCRRSPLSPHRRSPSPRRLPYRYPADRSPNNSHDWLFGRRSPSPRHRKVYSRSPSPYHRKRRRSFSPQRRPRSRGRRSRTPRSRSRSTSPMSWSRARSDTPTTVESKSPQSDGHGSPMHIDLTSYRRAEMALAPDKPWQPPGTHPRERHLDTVEPAQPPRYDIPPPGYVHGDTQWSMPQPGYCPKVPPPPGPFHPSAPTFYVLGPRFQHSYGIPPMVSMPPRSGSPMDPMQPHSHYQRNEMDMQPVPDPDVSHFNQQPSAPVYHEGPPPGQKLDSSISPPESEVVHPGSEDVKEKAQSMSQHEKRPSVSKNRDPRLCSNLQKVSEIETTAEYIPKKSQEHASKDKVVKENQSVTSKKPHNPATSEKSNLPGNLENSTSNKPQTSKECNKPEKSSKLGTSEKLIERRTPEKNNSPVKAKSVHIPGIMSPSENHLEINPRMSFLEGGSRPEVLDSVSITIDNDSAWDKLPLHDCTDEEGRPTETYGYSDEQYRSSFRKIEFGWPIQGTLRRKYLEKHIWDNPNAYKDNQKKESDVLSEEPKSGKRQKKTARKSFVTASLGHSRQERNNESLQEARSEELKKLKTEILRTLLNEKNMEEKVKLKGLLESIKKDIEKLEGKGKISGTDNHVNTVGRVGATGANSAVALAQRLATNLKSPKMRKTLSTSSTLVSSAGPVTSVVDSRSAVTATAILLDNTQRTSDNPQTSSTTGHVSSAVCSARALLLDNTPTSESPQTNRSTSSSVSSDKAKLLDNTPVTSLNIYTNTNHRPGTSTKPELGSVGSLSNLLSGASNNTTSFSADKPEAKTPANSSNSDPKPGTSRTETKPMITKSFFSGLG